MARFVTCRLWAFGLGILFWSTMSSETLVKSFRSSSGGSGVREFGRASESDCVEVGVDSSAYQIGRTSSSQFAVSAQPAEHHTVVFSFCSKGRRGLRLLHSCHVIEDVVDGWCSDFLKASLRASF